MKHTLYLEHIVLRRSKDFCLNVRDVRIPGGRILCVAGPNGSGKTSLVECLAGTLASPAISANVDGQKIGNNIRATKTLIGYIPDDEHWFIKELCATEYLALLTDIYADAGLPRQKLQYRIRTLASSLRFSDFEQPLESLSHGNKKKVQIIAGLIHEPRMVVIDELRNGLDPFAIIAAEDIVRMEAARGACIVAATHDLWWAERIADETMLLMDGQVVMHRQTSTLLEEFGSLEKLFMRLLRQGDVAHATV
jgi:ABC-2 type transport system ATP-binding protein